MKKIIQALEQDMAQGKNIALYEHVRGYLHPAEGYMLMLMAALGEGAGEVVEIGSFLGKSTCYLAHGLKTRQQGLVHAVDHFQGSQEHQAGMTHEEAVLLQEKTLYRQFMKNLRANGLDAHVCPVVVDSSSAARNWDKPIRLLFIDGDHSYRATRRDFQDWAGHVTEQGYIAFHDVGPRLARRNHVLQRDHPARRRLQADARRGQHPGRAESLLRACRLKDGRASLDGIHMNEAC